MPEVEGAPGVGGFRPERTSLVPEGISRRKLHREIETWREYEAVYRGRGIILLGVQDLWVELLIMRLMVNSRVSVASVCVGLDYTNYDLEPPSLTFLNPVTRLPDDPPFPPLQEVAGQGRNLAPGKHPETGRPFLCLPGVLEYHTHPEHNDGSWLSQYRQEGAGRLATIADFLWRSSIPVYVPPQPCGIVSAVPSEAAGSVSPDSQNAAPLGESNAAAEVAQETES